MALLLLVAGARFLALAVLIALSMVVINGRPASCIMWAVESGTQRPCPRLWRVVRAVYLHFQRLAPLGFFSATAALVAMQTL